MHEVPLNEHTDKNFMEALFTKVTNRDDETSQKHIKFFNKNFFKQ